MRTSQLQLLAKASLRRAGTISLRRRVTTATKLKDGNTIKVALDWTPNTNHSGFYVARAQGWYRHAGFNDIELSPPHDNSLTPGRQVATGAAAFGITPSETAISFATTDNDKPKCLAVAAVLQGSTSAVCTLKSSGIKRPRDLQGKRYASYGGRFEDAIVQRMVDNDCDSGKGSPVRFHPLDFHAYNDIATMATGSVVSSFLEKNHSDSTWIFTHWEGILAQQAGQQLNCFPLEDYGIPYGYSPVLLAHPDKIQEGEALDAFLEATAKGYKFAAQHPEEAAVMLMEDAQHPSLVAAGKEFVISSQKVVGEAYLDSMGKWGQMELARWADFVDFLVEHRIIRDRDGQPVAQSALDPKHIFRPRQ